MLLDPKVYVCSRTGADKVGYIAKAGDSVHEFLSDESDYDIYLNGHTVRVERDYVLQDGDMINAIHRPAGAVAAYVAVAVIVSLIVVATLPKPEKPNTQGTSSTSPNNQVSGQTNIARTGEGIPDIKGTIKSFPDVIQRPWYLFKGNSQRLFQTFCIGIGEYDVSDVRVGETLFDDNQAATFAVLNNGAMLSDNKYAYPVIGASGAEVLALNEIKAGIQYFHANASNNTLTISAIVDSSGSALFEPQLNLAQTDGFFIDESATKLTQKGLFEYDSFTQSVTRIDNPRAGNANKTHAVVYTFSITNRTLTEQKVYGNTLWVPGYNPNTKMWRSDQSKDGWSQIYRCKPQRKISINVQFPNGIRDSRGTIKTVNYEIRAYTNSSLTAFHTINDSARGITGGSSVAKTSEWKIFSVNKIHGFDIRRTTNRFNNGTDSMFVETAFSLQDGSATVGDGNVVCISTEYRTDGKTDKIGSNDTVSVIAARKQHYALKLGDNWVWYYGPQYNQFSEAILSDFVELFGKDKTEKLIDYDSLFTALSGVPNELKQFHYSYDDADISLGQRIHTACNAARVGAYRDGQTWRFYREESKPVTYHFDRRNIAGNAESQMSFRFQKPNDHDSVSLSYIDPVSNKELHINRKINLTSGTFEEGLGQRPLEIDLAGCRNTAQAVNRAELEVRRLVYQRRTVSERVLDDGLLVDIGDRVRWACIYDGDIVDGEVLEINGSQLKLSEKINLTGTLFGHITDVNGDVHGPYSVSAGSNGDFWIDGFDTSKALIANNMPTQLGSRVIIGTTSNLDYYDFTVTSKTPNADGTVQIEMIEYNELMFSED